MFLVNVRVPKSVKKGNNQKPILKSHILLNVQWRDKKKTNLFNICCVANKGRAGKDCSSLIPLPCVRYDIGSWHWRRELNLLLTAHLAQSVLMFL